MEFLKTYFVHWWLLGLLGLLPLLAGGWFLAEWRRRRALHLLAGGKTVPPGQRVRHGLLAVCGLVGLALLVIGSAGPQWGRDPNVPPSQGRDIMVVLDVSRSMLAEYPPRSRLARAKDSLYELADSVQRHGGYRLGLVSFAGQAKVLCPLTGDYDYFRFAVAEAHPDRLGPAGRLGKGEAGTQIRAALVKATEHLDPEAKGFQEILLISDGDDLAGDWQQGAEAARAAGVPVHTLAVGQPKPVPIPDGSGYLRSQGELVLTQRKDEVLRTIAAITQGTYQSEEVEHSLVQWFQNVIKPQPAREWLEDQQPLYQQRFAWFFAGALALVAAQMLLRSLLPRAVLPALKETPASGVAEAPRDRAGSRKRTESAMIKTSKPRPNLRWGTGLLISMLVILLGAKEPEDWVREGNAAFARGDYRAALAFYEQAEGRTSDPGRVAFNKAAAFYQLEEFAAAADEYRRCLEDATGVRRVQALYGLGNAFAQLGRGRSDESAISLLEQAIQSYQACLAEAATLDPAVHEVCATTWTYASENLQTVRSWLQKKQAELAQQPPLVENGGRAQSPRLEPEPGPPMDLQIDPGREPPGGTPQPTEQHRPGKGNLPLREAGDAEPFDPDRAEEYLREAMERLRQARAQRPPPGGAVDPQRVRDW